MQVKKEYPFQSVWIVLKEGYIGDYNACRGVAERLAEHPRTIYVSDIERAGSVSAYIEEYNKRSGAEVFPQVVISSYKVSTHIPFIIQLKRLSGNRTHLLQLRDPGEAYDMFDLIANPSHVIPITGPNVIKTVGVAHPLSPKTLAEGRALWQNELSAFDGYKKMAVMIGGDVPFFTEETGGGAFKAEDARTLGAELNAIAHRRNAALIVTNSKRTPEDAWDALCKEIADVPVYMHHYKLDAAKGNPYFGLLSIADELFPTADSMSMCSEACYTGKPVYIVGMECSNVRSDHRRLAEQLIHLEYAQPLVRVDKPWQGNSQPLDTAGFIADEFVRRIQKKNVCRSKA